MKFRFTLLTASLFMAGSALAQVQPQTSPPVHYQPGVPASQAHPPANEPAASAPAAAKVDPDKEKAIRQLMDITGESKLGSNMNQVVALQVRNAMSRKLPADRLDKFMTDFTQKLSTRAPANEVEDAEIPIYAQHFSLQELQGMIQFYQSPVGQQMVKTLPEVMQQSHETGAAIERKAALDTLQDMSNDYPELKPMLPQGQSAPSGPGGTQPPGSLKPQQPQSQQPSSQPGTSKPQAPAKPQ